MRMANSSPFWAGVKQYRTRFHKRPCDYQSPNYNFAPSPSTCDQFMPNSTRGNIR
jgi:hypothetical protein